MCVCEGYLCGGRAVIGHLSEWSAPRFQRLVATATARWHNPPPHPATLTVWTADRAALIGRLHTDSMRPTTDYRTSNLNINQFI